MRLVLTLFVALWLAGVPGAPAEAVESRILDTLRRWLATEPQIDDLRGLRRFAAADNAAAHFLLYEHYATTPRGGAGPRMASDMLVARAEAEAALRAAAALGLREAVFRLGERLFLGLTLRRDPAEARTWLEAMLEGPADESAAPARRMLAEILLFEPDLSAADRQRGWLLIEESLAAGDRAAVAAKARALREGAGVRADPAAARALLEKALTAGNPHAYAPLGEMLTHGTGGPADVKRGLRLLADPAQDSRRAGLAVLADIHLANQIVGRQPRKAAELMAIYAESDVATRQKLATLLIDYPVRLPNAQKIFLRLQEDEDAGVPGAAWTLLRLLRTLHEQFRDEKLTYEILDRNADTDDRVAVADAERHAVFSTRGDHSNRLAEHARGRIDALAARGVAAAWTLKGTLQRKGWAYPQDDVAATEAFLKGAELGDPDAMIALADAYEEGLGIPEDSAAAIRLLRQAAAQGSIEARRRLISAFRFDSFDRRLTLREGVTEAVVLYGNGAGSVNSWEFMSLLVNRRLADFDRAEVVGALMDGFRAAPAALAEERLVPMIQRLPQEVRAEMEAVLKAEGFLAGEAQGHFRPEARAALAAWTEARGPLPDAEMPVEAPPSAAPPPPDIPAEVVEAALTVVFDKVDAAQTDADWQEVLPMLASLARMGEPVSRWALLRWYQQSDLVTAVVTPEEIARYGFDLLLLQHPQMEKLEIEFLFTMTELYKARQGQEFADGFLALLRDDQRLRDPYRLDDILHRLMFLPGGCDMLLDGARARGVADLPAEECNNRETRSALLAWAESAGPAGIEEQARSAAVPEVYRIAGRPVP